MTREISSTLNYNGAEVMIYKELYIEEIEEENCDVVKIEFYGNDVSFTKEDLKDFINRLTELEKLFKDEQ